MANSSLPNEEAIPLLRRVYRAMIEEGPRERRERSRVSGGNVPFSCRVIDAFVFPI